MLQSRSGLIIALAYLKFEKKYGMVFSCVSVRELFAGLDEEHIETTIRSAALDETEYENIKQDVIKICDSIS